MDSWRDQLTLPLLRVIGVRCFFLFLNRLLRWFYINWYPWGEVVPMCVSFNDAVVLWFLNRFLRCFASVGDPLGRASACVCFQEVVIIGRWFWFVRTDDCGGFISIGVPGEGQLLVSVVGDFEHDARVARTDTTVGQFAGTSGSIIGNRWVNFGAGWSVIGDLWVNLRGRWVRLRGRKLFLCWTFQVAVV